MAQKQNRIEKLSELQTDISIINFVKLLVIDQTQIPNTVTYLPRSYPIRSAFNTKNINITFYILLIVAERYRQMYGTLCNLCKNMHKCTTFSLFIGFR